jgi:hypothetical protein
MSELTLFAYEADCHGRASCIVGFKRGLYIPATSAYRAARVRALYKFVEARSARAIGYLRGMKPR